MYYPLSQIVTNLYSSNGEFAIKADLSPYTGYYWKNSQGKFFTGKTPQDLPALELIQIQIELDDNIEGTPTNFTGTISKPLIKTEDALIENEIYIDLTKNEEILWNELNKNDKVNNDNIVNLLQYCDLIEELKKVNGK